ncbi:MAG TPA: Na+/H+ antiporter subunit D [Chlorobaculum parvum]|uniref:Na+/H+ antiporter subunit D n=1 Tax=Chlorobaculum parvum TaxID=274539 RepID=A0A7C5DFT5_9CHLB|nr:Na+/H+ antiporter subunit D [Chlorobaculum parvum]
MKLLLVMPILLPLVTALVMLPFRERPGVQRGLGLGASLAQAAVAVALLARVYAGGILTLQAGGWVAPFGITLVADLLSAVMVAATALIGLTTSIYSLGSIDRERERFFFHPLMQLLLVGINGAFLTGDLFNLYVWFEVMLISSFVLLALGGSPRQLEGSVKYVTINLLSSAIFLSAVGILYGVAGTLNMADLSARLPMIEQRELLPVVAVLLLVTFGVKAAIFPLFFWLPASYHTPPVAVSAIFAGLLTKVGVYAIMRVFTTVFTGPESEAIFRILLWIAPLTMVVGVLGAAAQYDLRKLLSFHIVSQIGYMLFAIAIQSPLAIAGGLFYIVHNIVAKTSLFYISGIVRHKTGAFQLKKIGGLYSTEPLLASLFLVSALALAGIPPLSGFWAKLMVIRAGLESGHYFVTGAALVVSLLTLFSMTKIWNEAFWKDDPGVVKVTDEVQGGGRTAMLYLPVVMLCGVIVFLGLSFEPVYELSARAAGQLLDVESYRNAVLGGGL